MSARLTHRIDDSIGQYRIVERIKSGGMGTVYKAVNSFSGTHYAVKECDVLDDPRRKSMSREEAVATFRGESQGVENLRHDGIPNGHSQVIPMDDFRVCLSCGNTVTATSCDICKVAPDSLFYQPAVIDARYYLFMEYIEGEDLDAVVRNMARPFTLEEANQVLAWMREIAAILDYLHGRQLAHCDIKPENIRMREGDGRLFLLDFGLLRVEPEPGAVTGKQTRILGGRKTLKMGTEGYAPPEQVAGNPGPGSDIYALGMTTLSLLTGLDPVNPVERRQLLEKDPAELVPGLQREPARLLARAVHPDASHRPTAGEWLAMFALGNAVRDLRASPRKRQNAKFKMPRLSYNLKLPAIILVALAVFTFLWINSGPDPSTILRGTAGQGAIYSEPGGGKVLQRLQGTEQLELVDAGHAEEYWLRILTIDGKRAKGFVRRDSVTIPRPGAKP